MMLLSELWRIGDSPWLRRTSGEISWKTTGSVRTVELLKITLDVLFILVDYLISSPFMVFSFQQGWDLPFAVQITLVFTHSHMPQTETSEKSGLRGNWGTGDHRGVTAVGAEQPFSVLSILALWEQLCILKTVNFFKVCWFILPLFFPPEVQILISCV